MLDKVMVDANSGKVLSPQGQVDQKENHQPVTVIDGFSERR